jgi:hypothetical protein
MVSCPVQNGDVAIRPTENVLHYLQREGVTGPELTSCVEALRVVLDRAKRHDLMRAATADRVVRLDDVSRRLHQAVRALAIAASELRRLEATDAAGLIEAARRESVRSFVADEEKKGWISLDGGKTPAI